MHGANQATGKPLSGTAHLKQSIADILRTRVGSRVMRREYGSKIPAILDRPTNAMTIIDIYAAIGEALSATINGQPIEPRFKLSAVTAVEISDTGRITIDISGTYLIDGSEITLHGIMI